MIPLATHLGVNLQIGPYLVDTPRWTVDPVAEVAKMSIDALNDGTVTISYWSHTPDLCYALGCKCEIFDDPGYFHVIDVVDGHVVDVENNKFDNFGEDNNNWHELNETTRRNWNLLGFDETNWDYDDDDFEDDFDDEEGEEETGVVVAVDRIPWSNFSSTQREAATRLGYNETTWDANCTVFQILVSEELQYCVN